MRPEARDRAPLLGISASFPRVWMAMQMENREHRNQIGLGGEEHPVREIAHQRAAKIWLDDGKLKRILQNPREGGIDLRLKPEAEGFALTLVSKRGLEDLELSLGGDVQPPHLPNGAEAGQQLLANVRPRPRTHLAAPVRRKPLGQDLAMPVGNRYVLWMLDEMVPEGLNVLELLVWRELVEARRRKCRLRHDDSIPGADQPHTTVNRRQEQEMDGRCVDAAGLRQGPSTQFHIIYVSANAFVPDQRTRRREAVKQIRHVLVDADGRADDVLMAIASRDDIPMASYVLRTSADRAHVLWRVIGFTSVMAEALQKQLAAELRTDPAATASTQLTRLPGFLYLKSPVVRTGAIDLTSLGLTYGAVTDRMKRAPRHRGPGVLILSWRQLSLGPAKTRNGGRDASCQRLITVAAGAAGD